MFVALTQAYLYSITTNERIQDGSLANMFRGFAKSEARIVLGCRGFDFDPDAGPIFRRVDLPRQISLAAARNILIEREPPADGSIVCFPDDDAHYATETLKVIDNIFRSSGCDFVIVRLDSRAQIQYPPVIEPIHTIRQVLSYAKSATLFVRADALSSRVFDERFGLGAKIGSGEDTELVLSLFLGGRQGVYVPTIVVGHPIKENRMEYFQGSICAMSKHLSSRPSLLWPIARRLLHGAIYCLRGQLSVSNYVKSWGSMFLTFLGR